MPKIFLCYRREDSGHQAGRLYDHLIVRFGPENVFKDVDSIPPGRDFRKVLAERVGQCDVLVALVGDQWLTASNPGGGRRIDDQADFVRIEIEAALGRDIPLIPLLVGRATVPTAESLPPSLQDFAYRHSLPIRPDPDFRNDVERLIRGIVEITVPATDEMVSDSPPTQSTPTSIHERVREPKGPDPLSININAANLDRAGDSPSSPDSVDHAVHSATIINPAFNTPDGFGPLIKRYGVSWGNSWGFWLLALAFFGGAVALLLNPEEKKKPEPIRPGVAKRDLAGVPIFLGLIGIFLSYWGVAHSRISVSLYERGFVYCGSYRPFYSLLKLKPRFKGCSHSWNEVGSVWVRTFSTGLLTEKTPLIKLTNGKMVYLKGVSSGAIVTDHMTVLSK